MKGLNEFYIVYAIIWFGLFGYMAYIHFKQRKLMKEIELLSNMVDKDGRNE